MIDLRAIVRAEMTRHHGSKEGAQAALARRLAGPWGVSPDSARRQLNRWLQGGSMTADHFAAVLAALGGRLTFDVTPPHA